MCGNCNIFRHFLLFPLLLSEPPEKIENIYFQFIQYEYEIIIFIYYLNTNQNKRVKLTHFLSALSELRLPQLKLLSKFILI